GGSWWPLLTRPISLVLLIVAAVMLAIPLYRRFRTHAIDPAESDSNEPDGNQPAQDQEPSDTRSSNGGGIQWAFHVVGALCILGLGIWWVGHYRAQRSGNQYPSRPVQILIPYLPGGGSDTFARAMQKGFREVGTLGQPVVVINQPGGSATIGSRNVKNAPPDGYKVLLHHHALFTANLSGKIDFGAEAFRVIAMTGELPMVILVRKDATWPDLAAMLEDAKQPGGLPMGVNPGSAAHFVSMQMEQRVRGAELVPVSAGGGAERIQAILRGEMAAGIFSLPEYLDMRGAEGTPADSDVRAIALLGNQRHNAIADVPTAKEQGVDVFMENTYFWYAPKGTPDVAAEHLATSITQAMESDVVRQELQRLRINPVTLTGDAMMQRLEQEQSRYAAVIVKDKSLAPDFVPWVLGLVILLAVGAVLEYRFLPRVDDQPMDGSNTAIHLPTLLGVCAVLSLYVAVLSGGWVPFPIATALMIFSIGGAMLRFRGSRMGTLLQIACLSGLAASFVFTEIFVSALPS
ncbi:MAG: tripartite tricarboxylate transporter substrate-binding protein, partial [Planctomycetota bacterium]